MPKQTCPVCNQPLGNDSKNLGDRHQINCPRCGCFSIYHMASRMMDPESSEKLGPVGSRERANLSSWLRQRTTPVMLTPGFLTEPYDDLGKQFWSIRPPSVKEQAEQILQVLGEETLYGGQRVEWKNRNLEFQARGWALNEEELLFLLNYLEKEGFVSFTEVVRSTGRIDKLIREPLMVTPKGWELIGKIQEKLGKGNQGFVAMWFDDSMLSFYEMGVAPAVAGAGYSPFKINDKEHVNKIDDEIVNEIRRSRFVVADFTGHRGGVYFEAGYAMGLGIPVIWCCSKKEIDDLHFDIRQYNCLDWEPDKLDVFARRLKERIISVCGERTNTVA